MKNIAFLFFVILAAPFGYMMMISADLPHIHFWAGCTFATLGVALVFALVDLVHARKVTQGDIA